MSSTSPDGEPYLRRPVHPVIERLGAYSWRLIAIGIVGWALLHVLGLLRLVVFPVVVALLLTAVISMPAHSLRSRGLPPLAAAWITFLGFLSVLTLAAFLVIPAFVDEFADLGPAVDDAYADVEDWIVDDAPFDVDRSQLEDLRSQAEDAIQRAASGSGAVVVRGAVVVLEVVASLVLALVLTFFFLKDGERLQRWALTRMPEERRNVARRTSARAWSTLRGYLRGSATLGALEAVIIGGTLWIAGAALVVPVAVITFAAAFVPFVGAVVAGVLAVAVTLATAGPGPALAVAVVAVIVQQFDNDLLAPVIFGNALDLHPVVILLVIASGGALAGLMVALLAVPVAAVILNVLAELNNDDDGLLPTAEPPAEGAVPAAR